MGVSDIIVRGARQHNLRAIDLRLPRNRLICFTGVSGSGKSSLAFDTLYAEGQRRYVESLSGFARQVLGQMPKPDVDAIAGLSPAISISQKTGGQNPRSTVGTITEIYDYLRVLYARVGKGHCPKCGQPITAQTREQIIQQILSLPQGTRFLLLAPVAQGKKGEHRELLADLLKQGFSRARVDGRVVNLTDDLNLDRQRRHDIEVVVDRLTASGDIRGRLAEAVELALRTGDGNLIVLVEDNSDSHPAAKANSPAASPSGAKLWRLSSHYACKQCNISFQPPSPQLFSFNSPQGMCGVCAGLGEVYTFDPALLVPDPSRSVQQGAIQPLGNWREMGRWRRHILRGVAEWLQRKHNLEPGTVLETAWEELDPVLQNALLWGTGDEHITFTWREGPAGYKWGGTFDGIIPELLARYRNATSTPQRRYYEKYMRTGLCNACNGTRLNEQARMVTLTTRSPHFRDKSELTLPEVCALPVSRAAEFFAELELDQIGQTIAAEVLKEIRGRLRFLINVGLEYITLDRPAPTLSGGEMQRIRLAGQIGCGLVGVLYVLDEPSIGLHPRDNQRLLDTLATLRDQGNTVIVVEHDEETIRAADWVVDFGPGAGVRGGEVVAAGPLRQVIAEPRSATGQYLSGRRQIPLPSIRRTASDKWLVVRGAAHNNLKNIDVAIPLGLFVCITGVSGSGKSSLVNDILVEALRRDLMGGVGNPGKHQRIDGLEHLDKMIAIDQSPIGRTPRSNPATYIKLFDEIRKLFASLPEAKARGYTPGRFSFNVSGGRCEACEGNGANRLEMDFLADVWVTCPVCAGRRFNRETLQVKFKGCSIADVLEMDVQEALEHFQNIPPIRNKLQTLHDVGLDYMKLGQPSPTLSGGEAQRVKLARELVKISTGRTLYLLDEPTTGLHMADIELLLRVLHGFVEAGNTVVVVEHNLEVVKTADWIIDLGPEGGDAGGWIVAAGTPEQICQCEASHTGRVLRQYLAQHSKLAAGRKARQPTGQHTPAAAIAATGAATGFATGAAAGAAGGAPAVATTGDGRSAHWAVGLDEKSGLGLDERAAFAADENQQSAADSLSAAQKRRKGRAKPVQFISVRGAQQHNLKCVDVDIPREQMVVCCGPSGSGKSSLAMDTIYAEGQRRYVESLSAYARQFVAQMQKPKVEHIEGLSPAIAIEQKHLGQTPRSTVGTVTEVYDYLRILMARLGTQYCPECELPVGTQSADQIIDNLLQHPPGARLYLMAPVDVLPGESYEGLWEQARASGYARVRVDGQTYSLDSPPSIDRRSKHSVQIVVDRVTVAADARSRIAGSVETALALGKGVLHVAVAADGLPEPQWPVEVHSQHFACRKCGRSFEPLAPHNFSFNSPLGWCPACEGLGVQIGTDPAALLRDPKLSLAQGAVALWPSASNKLFGAMLDSFCRATGVASDVPLEQLSARHKRLVFHGSGERWFEATVTVPRPSGAGDDSAAPPVALKFQYKGLYPALDEASRLLPALRSKLEHLVEEVECTVCGGSRLRDDAAAVRLRGRTIQQFCQLPLGTLLEEFRNWRPSDSEQHVAGEVIQQIRNRLQFLVDVGLDYLTLGRSAPTLSGGEMQRIRLAAQLGSGLCGVLYVLDEPTIGLHPRDNRRLLDALRKLRDLGNTLLVVEHDREVVRSADRLLDFGPGAGRHGGQIVAQGKPDAIARNRKSVTGPYLSGKKAIAVPKNRRKPSAGWLEIRGARHNNLKNIDVRIPLGTLTVVTGVSGSGKSSLVEDILYKSLARTLHRARTTPGAHEAIDGIEQINKVIRVDQQPLGQTPNSNPATFTGVFELIRELYAQLPAAKLRGYTARRFSFNVPGGRCEKCEGNGQLRIEMHFLPDVWVTCDECQGRRYNAETLAVTYHGRSIADVLEMPCRDALQLFQNIPKIRRILQLLCDVGLDYIALGQPAPTLSGGEAQRVKLAAELARPDTGQTLYVLDEPTTGLHFEDLAKLLDVLHRLVDLGNTVLVVEHNLDVIKTADWVIDLGPEAGQQGGYLVAAGTPEDIVAHNRKLTAQCCAPAGEASGPQQPGETRPGMSGDDSAGQSLMRSDAGAGSPRVISDGRAARPLMPSNCGAEPPLMFSHTGAALAPVLEAGPYQKRQRFDFAAAEAPRQDDLEITDVGRDALMPWQIDGRRWHTVERVARNGQPCRWDGRILEEIVDRIEARAELFGPTDWCSRSVVEIRAARRSDVWFFHAITSDQWLLKMKFRTARNTFKQDTLVRQLDLKPLNDMPELPVYGTEPRVRCRNMRGPWQEIELRVYSFAEIDRPEFWNFLQQAIEGFARLTQRAETHGDVLRPWKQLGRAWHLSRRGFPPGKTARWQTEVLEKLFDLLAQVAPQAQFAWDNKVLVPLTLPGRQQPWATVNTKKLEAVELTLIGPKGRFPLGSLTELGSESQLDGRSSGYDAIKLKFHTPEQVQSPKLKAFLVQHLEASIAAE